MNTYDVEVALSKYIAHPYWPEQERLINIRKQSGVDRARSEDKREKSLNAFLKKIGMNAEAFKELERMANQPWYRVNRNDENSPIVIPKHQIEGMLVHAASEAPSGIRVPVDNLRSLIRASDFVTNRKKEDGKFERFVQPKDGKGNPLSNQRRFTVNPYISMFTATGTITFEETVVKAATAKDLLTYALFSVGVGACRKMDYGRGEVVRFEKKA
jgi:hypothetical protein